MNAYTGPDEYPIGEIPPTPWWSENFAAMYASPATPIAVFYSIGRWHSDPQVWREVILISLPGERVLFSKGYGRNGTPQGPGSSLSRYEILEPGKQTRLIFDGPMAESGFRDLVEHGARNGTTAHCKLDLRFDSAAPVWNMKGTSAEAATMAGSIHIDHIGTVNGSIEYGGEIHQFVDGYSVRDHSRGAREVSKYGSHNWLSGRFPDGRGFYVYAMKSWGSTAIGMSNAAIVAGDRLYDARLLHTEFIGSSAECGKRHRLVLGSEIGDMEIEFAEILNMLPTSMVSPYDTAPGAVRHRGSALIYDEFVRVSCDGMTGYGWSERGFASERLA